MPLSTVADGLQVIQGLAIILLFFIAIGAWRQKTDATPANLERDLSQCRQECARRLAAVEASLAEKASKETMLAELRGISRRLANIERAVLPQAGVAEEG